MAPDPVGANTSTTHCGTTFVGDCRARWSTSLPVTRAVPPPGQQVAALQERLLEEAHLTRDKRIELTKRLIESIERGLEAETVKGPQSVTVPDNMARMRAAELLAQLLNVGTAASRRESNTATSVVINITEPEWLRNPSSEYKVPGPAVIDVPAVKEDASKL
jgi:hypothetical protein